MGIPETLSRDGGDRDFSWLRWGLGQLMVEVVKLPVECFQRYIPSPLLPPLPQPLIVPNGF